MEQLGAQIAIVQIPSPLLEPFGALREARSEDEAKSLIDHSSIIEASRAVVDYARKRFERATVERDHTELKEGIAVRARGLPTVTTESGTRTLIGLHVDDWYALPLAQRQLSPNRLCVNLGGEDRYLLFCAVPLTEMYESVKRSGVALPADCGGTAIARRFLALHPAEPIFRLRVRPGEAYIAPTENVAHDASSSELARVDVSLQLRGRFAPD